MGRGAAKVAPPWTLAAALLAVLATAAPGEIAEWLVADASALAGGQVWRLFSGPLVHATPGHLALDLAVLLAAGAAFEASMRRLWPWLLAAGLAVPVAAVFPCHPELEVYYGTSGLTHALLAGAAVCELQRGARRPLAALLLAGLAAKVIWETLSAAPLVSLSLGPGVRQLPVAHLAGAVTGAAVACLVRRRYSPARCASARIASGQSASVKVRRISSPGFSV